MNWFKTLVIWKYDSLESLQNWDVSNEKDFSGMF